MNLSLKGGMENKWFLRFVYDIRLKWMGLSNCTKNITTQIRWDRGIWNENKCRKNEHEKNK